MHNLWPAISTRPIYFGDAARDLILETINKNIDKKFLIRHSKILFINTVEEKGTNHQSKHNLYCI
jgi:hypothetical protein